MKFGLILAGVTVVTLIIIFGFYKLFLEKKGPAPIADNLPGKVKTIGQVSESLPVSSAIPASNPSSLPAASASIKPKASFFKSTIGTITVLQNNTSSQYYSSGQGTSAISGTISFSGTAPTGTSIVIVARENGSDNSYKTVVSGISASNNAKWSWSTAESGKAYDLITVLKGSSGGVDTDYATSQVYVVTAPALNQIFSVNAAAPPSAPTGTITTTCTTHNSNNTWVATVNFPTVSGAEWYILQVGTTSAGTDIINKTQGVQSGTNQTVSATLTDSILYYAQYSIASVPYPTSYQYSAFSTPKTIKCP